MSDTPDTLYKLTCDDSIALDNDGHLRPGVRDTYGDNGDFAGWVVPVQKCVHGSYSEHRLADGGWCYGAMLDHEPSFIGPVG